MGPLVLLLQPVLQPCTTRFPIFFRCWPRIFNDVTEKTSCPILISILDEHFFPQVLGGRCRDLAWSAVLSVYVLAGQMALHYHRRGMTVVLSQLKECVGAYMKRVICSEIQDKGGLVRIHKWQYIWRKNLIQLNIASTVFKAPSTQNMFSFGFTRLGCPLVSAQNDAHAQYDLTWKVSKASLVKNIYEHLIWSQSNKPHNTFTVREWVMRK